MTLHINPKSPQNVPRCLARFVIAEPFTNTEYAKPSCVRAQLDLLRQAMATSDAAYFAYVCGSSAPVRAPHDMCALLRCFETGGAAMGLICDADDAGLRNEFLTALLAVGCEAAPLWTSAHDLLGPYVFKACSQFCLLSRSMAADACSVWPNTNQNIADFAAEYAKIVAHMCPAHTAETHFACRSVDEMVFVPWCLAMEALRRQAERPADLPANHGWIEGWLEMREHPSMALTMKRSSKISALVPGRLQGHVRAWWRAVELNVGELRRVVDKNGPSCLFVRKVAAWEPGLLYLRQQPNEQPKIVALDGKRVGTLCSSTADAPLVVKRLRSSSTDAPLVGKRLCASTADAPLVGKRLRSSTADVLSTGESSVMVPPKAPAPIIDLPYPHPLRLQPAQIDILHRLASTEHLRCLNVRQPWASLLVEDIKHLENRGGGANRPKFNLQSGIDERPGEWVLIIASLAKPAAAVLQKALADFEKRYGGEEGRRAYDRFIQRHQDKWVLGGAVGVVLFDGMIDSDQATTVSGRPIKEGAMAWYHGAPDWVGWHSLDAISFPTPIHNIPGALSIAHLSTKGSAIERCVRTTLAGFMLSSSNADDESGPSGSTLGGTLSNSMSISSAAAPITAPDGAAGPARQGEGKAAGKLTKRVRIQSPTSPSSKHFSEYSHLESERPAFDLMASRRHWECPPTKAETGTAAQAQAKRLRIENKNAAQAAQEAMQEKRAAARAATEKAHPSKEAAVIVIESTSVQVAQALSWSPTLIDYPCAMSKVTSAQLEPLSVCSVCLVKHLLTPRSLLYCCTERNTHYTV